MGEEEKKEEDEKKAAEEREAKKKELMEQKEAISKEEYEKIPDWKVEVFTKIEPAVQDYALCVDTLGSMTRIDKKAKDYVVEQVKKSASVLERCDKGTFIEELERHFELAKMVEENPV